MRGRSWSTGRPAPRFRCPTSLLPIWPTGSPTASPTPRAASAATSRSSASPAGMCAAAIASSAGRAPIPKPSRTDEDESGAAVIPALSSEPRAAAVSPARATMPAISSTFRLAPPTSAPSMSGSARNSSIAAARDAAAVEDRHAARRRWARRPRPAFGRMRCAMADASLPRAVRPVPIAQTGS